MTHLTDDMFITIIGILGCGLIFTFMKDEHLRNLIKTMNKYRVLQLEPKSTVQLMRLVGKGALIIGTFGTLSYIFQRLLK
jgi:hypothetical protein